MPAAHVTYKILSTIDLLVIGLYFCVVFAIGFYFSRKERTSTHYFLAGRNVGWFAIGASLLFPISRPSTLSAWLDLANKTLSGKLPVSFEHNWNDTPFTIRTANVSGEFATRR